MLSPSRAAASRVASSVDTPSARLAALSAPQQVFRRKRVVGVADERRRHFLVRVHDYSRPRRGQHRERLLARRHDQVCAEQEIDLAGRDAHAVQTLGIVRDAHVRQHSAEFLSEARLVELENVLALEVRGQAEQTAGSDHAGAADAGDQNVVHRAASRRLRLREARQRLVCERARRVALRAAST